MEEVIKCTNKGLHLTSCDNDGFCNHCGHQGEVPLPYGISTSDGHDEDWEYFTTESEALKRFEALKHHENDIHLYEYTKLGYEVIDGFWLGEYECLMRCITSVRQ